MTALSDHATEELVIGACLDNSDLALDVTADLRPPDFEAGANREVYSAICALVGSGIPLDEMTVAAELERRGALAQVGGHARLSALADVPTTANVLHHTARLRDLALRRRLVCVAATAAEQAGDLGSPAGDIVDAFAAQVLAIGEGGVTGPRPVAELVRAELKDLDEQKAGGARGGLLTGFHGLDRKIGGLRPGELIVVAARPSMGKSALNANTAGAVAARGGRVLTFSLEMTGRELVQREAGARAKVNGERLRACRLDTGEDRRYREALADLAPLPLAIDDTAGLTLAELRARARRHKARHGLDLVTVDHLGLMRAPGQNREREVSAIAEGLKDMAKDLDVPVIALSQLSRACESRDDRRPRLSDLRDSGGIEQAANVVILLYRHAYYFPKTAKPREAELNVAKNRGGPTGVVLLDWCAEFVRFSNPAGVQAQEPMSFPGEAGSR